MYVLKPLKIYEIKYKPIENKKIQCKVLSAANSDVVQQIRKRFFYDASFLPI